MDQTSEILIRSSISMGLIPKKNAARNVKLRQFVRRFCIVLVSHHLTSPHQTCPHPTLSFIFKYHPTDKLSTGNAGCFLLAHTDNTCSAQTNHANFFLSKAGTATGTDVSYKMNMIPKITVTTTAANEKSVHRLISLVMESVATLIARTVMGRFSRLVRWSI